MPVPKLLPPHLPNRKPIKLNIRHRDLLSSGNIRRSPESEPVIILLATHVIIPRVRDIGMIHTRQRRQYGAALLAINVDPAAIALVLSLGALFDSKGVAEECRGYVVCFDAVQFVHLG